jgi:hypothetical protein
MKLTFFILAFFCNFLSYSQSSDKFYFKLLKADNEILICMKALELKNYIVSKSFWTNIVEDTVLIVSLGPLKPHTLLVKDYDYFNINVSMLDSSFTCFCSKSIKFSDSSFVKIKRVDIDFEYFEWEKKKQFLFPIPSTSYLSKLTRNYVDIKNFYLKNIYVDFSKGTSFHFY